MAVTRYEAVGFPASEQKREATRATVSAAARTAAVRRHGMVGSQGNARKSIPRSARTSNARSTTRVAAVSAREVPARA